MDDKKSNASTNTTTPPTTQPASPSLASSPVKGPLVSRRRFLQGAVAASVVLAAASVGASGQILGPLIPTAAGSQDIIDWTTLDNQYQNVKNGSGLYQPISYSEFFYYPYDSSVSPYYKNIIARLPDKPTPLINPLYPSDPILSHVVAYTVTCVHLRCLVNPGYAGNPGSGEFRLQCPCHGSQYRLIDGVPVAGPAFDLGLNPLPQVHLQVDSSGKISAVGQLNGVPGIGRTQ